MDILDYVVTSNHVHLLLWAQDGKTVSGMMQYVQGTTGRDFNFRKEREGSFWRGRYYPTLIQNGEHLRRCLFYIDLNMVRAKAVIHPREWRFCGYHELCGVRKRYRILNRDRLLTCLGAPCDGEGFASWYNHTLNEKLRVGYHFRESLWSECVAVGDLDWIEGHAKRLVGINKEIVCYDPPRDLGEDEKSYGLKVGIRAGQGLAAYLEKNNS